MVSRPGSPTLNSNTNQPAPQSTDSEITVSTGNAETYNFRNTTKIPGTGTDESPELRRLKLSRRAHKGCMTRFLSSAEELLENETASFENISKLKQIETKKRDLVAKNLEIEAIILLEDLEAEIEENTQTLEEIDNIVFDL